MVVVLRPALAALALLSTTIRPSVAATATAQCPFPAFSRAYTMSDPSPSSPEFLQDRLSTLLASPHIHFNKPPALLNIRMGPGPVDVFSTRFANWFTHDATGVVNGKQVDKEGLKEALLALQKKWHPDSANFVAQDSSSKVRLLSAARTCGCCTSPRVRSLRSSSPGP